MAKGFRERGSGAIERVVYSLERGSGSAHRSDRGTGFWRSGFIQGQRVLVGSSRPEQFSSDAAHAIALDLVTTHPGHLERFPAEVATFEQSLERQLVRALARFPDIDVSWLRCVALIERAIPSLDVRLTRLLAEIRQFERRLAVAAAAGGLAVNDPTRGWDIEDMIIAVLSRRRYPPDRAPRLAGYLMDLKFKLFSITCVDLPIYKERVARVGAESEAGRLLALSFDSSTAFKCRSLWETVMNLAYYLETGNDAEQLGKRKSERWWAWVRKQRNWRGLAKFQRLVERHDALLRTPETHKLSRLRSVFATRRSARRHRALAGQLLNQSIAAWDHLSFVVSLNKGVTYQRGRQVLKS